MANERDLELLERFTDALGKSRNVGATEIGPDSRVTLHVMPDRVIEAVRARILDLEGKIYNITVSIGTELKQISYPKGRKAEVSANISHAEKWLIDYGKESDHLHRSKVENGISNSRKAIVEIDQIIDKHERCISDYQREIEEIRKLQQRYEEIILRLLEVCING